MWQKIKPYVISILISASVGALSALLTMGSMDIYSELKAPPLAPPSFLFPIVWSILYVLMGVSAAIIYGYREEKPKEVKSALTTYGASLIVNFFWSIIFFNLRMLLASFAWIILLLYLVLKTIVQYQRINKAAAYLQIPYALWVAFASYLNLGIWFLNR